MQRLCPPFQPNLPHQSSNSIPSTKRLPLPPHCNPPTSLPHQVPQLIDSRNLTLSQLVNTLHQSNTCRLQIYSRMMEYLWEILMPSRARQKHRPLYLYLNHCGWSIGECDCLFDITTDGKSLLGGRLAVRRSIKHGKVTGCYISAKMSFGSFRRMERKSGLFSNHSRVA
jgi:hypothetical protein